jgi:hypothetical protein
MLFSGNHLQKIPVKNQHNRRFRPLCHNARKVGGELVKNGGMNSGGGANLDRIITTKFAGSRLII